MRKEGGGSKEGARGVGDSKQGEEKEKKDR